MNGKSPGTQLKESGIVAATGIRNPSSTDEEPKIQYLQFNQEGKHLFLILKFRAKTLHELTNFLIFLSAFFKVLVFFIGFFLPERSLIYSFRD